MIPYEMTWTKLTRPKSRTLCTSLTNQKRDDELHLALVSLKHAGRIKVRLPGSGIFDANAEIGLKYCKLISLG